MFISGQISINPETNEFIDGEIEIQTEQVLKNIKAILEAGGSSLEDVVKVTIYLQDIKDFVLVNNIYSKYFGENLPARSCVEVSKLPKDAKIEIETIAVCNK